MKRDRAVGGDHGKRHGVEWRLCAGWGR